MAALPYMQLYVADYLADTAHLTTEEHGAYLLLLFSYWQTGKPLRADRLSSVSRLSSERWTDVERTLKDFFHINNGTWTHFRVEADLEKVGSKSKQNSEAGKASARARALAKQHLEEAIAANVPTDVATNVERTYQRNVNHTRSGDTDTDTDTEQDQEHLLSSKVLEGELLTDQRSKKRKTAKVLVGVDDLIDAGCDPDHARDWLTVRKSKKAELTPTSWKMMNTEAVKAGITVAEAVQLAAENGWQAFKSTYDWKPKHGFGQNTGTSRESRPSLVDQVRQRNAAAQAERDREAGYGSEGPGELWAAGMETSGIDWGGEFDRIDVSDGKIVGVDD